MQKRERDREMETHTRTHTHTHSERETETEENGEPQVNNFDSPGERPPEISNLWSFPV